MMRRLRLIDTVWIAAVALLGLKGISYLAMPSPPAPQAAGGAGLQGRAEQLPAFGRVIAYARSNYLPPDVAATGTVPERKSEDKEEPAAPKPSAFEPVPPPVSPSERAILERLGERRDDLQQRSRALEMRERLLENAERKLEARINELKALEDRAQDTATRRGDTEAAALRNLVTMYETMKPKDAARVFDRLALDVLVPVVLQMNPRKMAEILAAMSAEAAEKLTVALANRARGLSAEGRMPAPAPGLPPNELPAIEQPAPRPKS